MPTLPRHLVVTTLCALAGMTLPPRPAVAQQGVDALCAVFLLQQQTDLEDLDLAVQQDETRLAAAAEIFVLLDGLWQNDLIGHLPYLGAKHRRDTADISLQQSRRRLERQQAVVDQYRLACPAGAAQQPVTDLRDALEAAYRRYLAADCALRTLDVALFEVDLEYQQEVLKSATDLRLSDIASRQQVLFAERDVELTQEQLEQARERSARCSR